MVKEKETCSKTDILVRRRRVCDPNTVLTPWGLDPLGLENFPGGSSERVETGSPSVIEIV